jgi:hypothetical protein
MYYFNITLRWHDYCIVKGADVFPDVHLFIDHRIYGHGNCHHLRRSCTNGSLLKDWPTTVTENARPRELGRDRKSYELGGQARGDQDVNEVGGMIKTKGEVGIMV